jgi:hypothetical protein
MASKIKKQLQSEILEVAGLLDDGSTKKALLEGLYNQIDKYEDDRDIVNTVWANRDLPLRMFTNDELGMMPGFSNIIVGERYDKKIDYDKTFGKDWYKNTANIPYNQVAIVAAKQGREPRQVIQEMTDEAIKRNRYDVAHDGVLGTVLPFVAKRTQEAIERGEEPQPEDYGLDLLQTGLEATPYGRAAKFINNPAGKFIVGRILSNSTAPLLTEVADAAAYDSTNTYGRGDFSKADVGSGIITNMLGEGFLRTGGAVLNKVTGGKAGTRLMNLGEGKSAQEARKETFSNINNDLNTIKRKKVIGQNFGDINKQVTNPTAMDVLRSEAIDYYDNANIYATRETILKKLKGMYNEKGKKVNKKADLSDEDIRFMQKDPVLSKYIGAEVGYTPLPTETRLAGEEAIKNLITNKLGGYQQEQGKAFTRIPFGIGPKIQKWYDDQAAEELEREEEERIYNQYKLDLLGGR